MRDDYSAANQIWLADLVISFQGTRPMNVCFVTAPTAAEFEGLEELSSRSVRWAASYPQLGILSLAAVL
jgi:hypothetical protein